MNFRKFAKIAAPITVVIFAGLIVGLSFLHASLAKSYTAVAKEAKSATADKNNYDDKANKCAGAANTTLADVNAAGINNCGAKRAMGHLTVMGLASIQQYCSNDIWQTGGVDYGCFDPSTGEIYVCRQGSTYNPGRKIVGYWIYYYDTAVCDDEANTIRHELLHTVYDELNSATQTQVSEKLQSYYAAYQSKLSPYSASQQREELFVRVGADGRPVGDIQLAELYSQVSAAYQPQVAAYYGDLAATSDQYISKYDDLMKQYDGQKTAVTTFIVLCSILFAAVVVATIVIFVKLRKGDFHETFRHEQSSTGDELDDLRRKIYHRETNGGKLENSRNNNSADDELDNLRRKIYRENVANWRDTDDLYDFLGVPHENPTSADIYKAYRDRVREVESAPLDNPMIYDELLNARDALLKIERR